ncbi:cold shock domain-containing protein [Streptomyces angustmyceticus]|uniref:DNA-binding protein n=1 Tax=Streptomyces angustmyceticus TaxID=285578 RepID=A0A5J4LPS9_9ACTN|nr:cold shock domain-containing protein [Streptomyces angustmyceticus]UAL70878.1 cold shock domain-containing protein [Streptomyces angustmyceticus]GES34002.1 DNA-binding protein [Streptomyces angustmyceticus]
MATGTVVRFDEVRGYGFIAPDAGGEDVFVHVNDLCDEKHLFRSGLRVAYTTETGDRGLKAGEVQLLEPARAVTARRQAPGAATARPAAEPDEDLVCEVLSAAEFRGELTEALLDAAPSLTAAQLLQVRKRVMELAQTHNWIDA